jgi:DNA-binding HxlR family transcriptional regulator
VRQNRDRDIFDEDSVARDVLGVIATKWCAMIVTTLARGPRRYSELQREIGGISQKMLTQTLRHLERGGLVERTLYPVVPPRVEYRLTRLGETLIEPLNGMLIWTQEHLNELREARARYDREKRDGD